MIVPVTVVFILTILALIASLFGNPEAPVSKWLDANGNKLLMWEFVAIIFLSLLAMTVDRIRTLRGIDEPPLMDSDTASGTNPPESPEPREDRPEITL